MSVPGLLVFTCCYRQWECDESIVRFAVFSGLSALFSNPAVQSTLQSFASQGLQGLEQLAAQGMQALLGMITGGGSGGGGAQGSGTPLVQCPCHDSLIVRCGYKLQHW